MSATAADPVTERGPGWASSLWNRQLDSYPNTGRRMTYLAITVLATITLYYELYVRAGAVVHRLERTPATWGRARLRLIVPAGSRCDYERRAKPDKTGVAGRVDVRDQLPSPA
jgi:hypothetical protein